MRGKETLLASFAFGGDPPALPEIADSALDRSRLSAYPASMKREAAWIEGISIPKPEVFALYSVWR